MIICDNKKCKKVIKMGETFKTIGYGYHFCSDECILAASKEETIERSCDNCFNCIEESESSMFGTNNNKKCKKGIEIDYFEKVKNCQQFIYGSPEEKHYSYSSDELTTKEAVLYEEDK